MEPDLTLPFVFVPAGAATPPVASLPPQVLSLRACYVMAHGDNAASRQDRTGQGGDKRELGPVG